MSLLIRCHLIDYASLGMKPSTTETLRRGMSVALHPTERPTPPVRRTPSIATGPNGQMKRPDESRAMPAEIPIKTLNPINDNDFPPPPDFLLSNESTTLPPAPPKANPHLSLLEEIQRGGFKLRKTVIERDRSAPRFR